MTSTVDQKTYLLNKYLKPSGDKKKKKKKHVKGTGLRIINDDLDTSRMRPLESSELEALRDAPQLAGIVDERPVLRIIDDDVDTSRMRPLESSELEALGLEDEDAPQVAGIVDERPEELRTMEEYGVGTKWRVVAQNDGIDSKLSVEEIKRNIAKVDDEVNPIFGKMYSDSEDEKKNDSDLSPPRKTDAKLTTSGNVDRFRNKQIHRTSDSDLRGRNRKDSTDSDLHRKTKDSYKSSRHESKRLDSDLSPSRIKTRKKLDEHLSPPRRNLKDKSELKSRNKQIRRDSDSDLSPPRSKNRRNSDSDLSPPRKDSKHKSSDLKFTNKQIRGDSDSDLSPPRSKNRRNSDSDLSPPRKRQNNSRNEKELHRNRRDSSDSDLSPPRKHEERSKDRPRKTSRWGHFGPEVKDQKSAARSPESTDRKRKDSKHNYDSDLSPPRHNKNISPQIKASRPKNRDRSTESPKKSMRSPERSFSRNERSGPSRSRDDRSGGERGRYEDKRYADSPPPSNKKMAKTLEGKTAGLQDARQLKDENAAFRRREDELYSKMSGEMSGRDATTVNRRLGKRETSAEREKNRADQARRKEMEEKYSKWGKGLKQVADQNARVEDYLHEASKPLARHRDDADLERTLKAQERAGDPMLEYMRGKKKEDFSAPERPIFKGDYPPNRFNIRPGYRWDGVDRSNGYEKKYFDHKSKAKALADEAYKWSSEDL